MCKILLEREISSYDHVVELEAYKQQLAGSAERYYAFINQSFDGVYIFDPVLWRVEEVNNRLAQMMGYEIHELVALQLTDFIAHPLKEITQFMKKAVKKGQKFLGRRYYRHKNGSLIEVEVALSLVQLSDRQVVIANVRDISIRSIWKERWRVAEAYIEITRDAIMVVNHNKSIIEINPAFTRLTGYELADINGAYYQFIEPFLGAEGTRHSEVWINRKNGDPLCVWISKNSIRNEEGEVTHYIIVFSDITEQKKLQRILVNEVQLASQVQKSFLTPDCNEHQAAIRGIFRPFHQISGDLYGYKWLDGRQRLFGYLLDITGHGVSTSLRATSLSVLLRQAAERNEELAERLAWVNKQSADYFSDDVFAAVQCFEFDFVKRTLTYVAAGITYFLSSYGKIMTPGLFVGVSETAQFEAYSMPIQAGDRFYFLTDGISDHITEDMVAKIEDANFADGVSFLRQMAQSSLVFDDATCIAIQVGIIDS